LTSLVAADLLEYKAMNKAVVSLIGVLLLSGCIKAKYEDVSNDERYSSLVGHEYRFAEDLIIHGVLDYPTRDQVLDFYVVTAKPGFDGPEVVSRGLLPAGTMVHIEKVMDCTNCFESGIHLQVEILSQERYRDHPVSLYVEPVLVDGRAVIQPGLLTRVVD
jgi:hypothetical protein